MSSEPPQESPPSSPEREPSPPRKRPRTRAPPGAAAAFASIKSRPGADTTLTTRAQPVPTPQRPAQVHRFSLHPICRFDGAASNVRRPREVANFSYNDHHEYRDDESGINYYVPPPIGADMKEGFDTFRHYEDHEDPHLDSLLKALVIKAKARGEEAHTKADFVTWRGMMTKIMTAPFDNFAEFSMFATLHDGTIYLEEDFPLRAAQRAAEINSRPPRYQHSEQPSREMMTYWGYKFETLCLIPTPAATTPRGEIEAHQRSIVSNHAQHCSIVHTSFGPHTLLLGGEVDGLSAPKSPDPTATIPWVELKTSEELPVPQHQQPRDILKFERKLLKFWAQSFLLGVPRIIVGFRSKTGILKCVQTFNTHELPGMVKRGSGCWDAGICINFTKELLGWLKGVVTGDGVYRVSMRKKSGLVEVQRVADGTGAILSEEFLAWRKERARAKEENMGP